MSPNAWRNSILFGGVAWLALIAGVQVVVRLVTS